MSAQAVLDQPITAPLQRLRRSRVLAPPGVAESLWYSLRSSSEFYLEPIDAPDGTRRAPGGEALSPNVWHVQKLDRPVFALSGSTHGQTVEIIAHTSDPVLEEPGSHASPVPVPEVAPQPAEVPMELSAHLRAQLDAIDPGDDIDDVRDDAEEKLDAAWEAAKTADWLDPKEARRSLGDIGDLLKQAAALALLGAAADRENWRALGRKAGAWLKRFLESTPEELRKQAETKKKRAAKAKLHKNQARHDKLMAEAQMLETEAKLAEARRGNGSMG